VQGDIWTRRLCAAAYGFMQAKYRSIGGILLRWGQTIQTSIN
jgi:hypothetical protein